MKSLLSVCLFAALCAVSLQAPLWQHGYDYNDYNVQHNGNRKSYGYKEIDYRGNYWDDRNYGNRRRNEYNDRGNDYSNRYGNRLTFVYNNRGNDYSDRYSNRRPNEYTNRRNYYSDLYGNLRPNEYSNRRNYYSDRNDNRQPYEYNNRRNDYSDRYGNRRPNEFQGRSNFQVNNDRGNDYDDGNYRDDYDSENSDIPEIPIAGRSGGNIGRNGYGSRENNGYGSRGYIGSRGRKDRNRNQEKQGLGFQKFCNPEYEWWCNYKPEDEKTSLMDIFGK